MPQARQIQARAPRREGPEERSRLALEAPPSAAPALADSSLGAVPAVAPEELGRGGQGSRADATMVPDVTRMPEQASPLPVPYPNLLKGEG